MLRTRAQKRAADPDSCTRHALHGPTTQGIGCWQLPSGSGMLPVWHVGTGVGSGVGAGEGYKVGRATEGAVGAGRRKE